MCLQFYMFYISKVPEILCNCVLAAAQKTFLLTLYVPLISASEKNQGRFIASCIGTKRENEDHGSKTPRTFYTFDRRINGVTGNGHGC